MILRFDKLTVAKGGLYGDIDKENMVVSKVIEKKTNCKY